MEEEGKCRVESLSQSSTKHRQTLSDSLTVSGCGFFSPFFPFLSIFTFFASLLSIFWFLSDSHTHTHIQY